MIIGLCKKWAPVKCSGQYRGMMYLVVKHRIMMVENLW